MPKKTHVKPVVCKQEKGGVVTIREPRGDSRTQAFATHAAHEGGVFQTSATS
jgi:hypothetical protein